MKPVNPPGLAAPRGYSHGIEATGRMLFVAGQIGWNDRGELVSEQLAHQFDQALANVLTVVSAAGGSPESIVRLTIYVTDKSDYLTQQKTIGERYRARMGRHYPAMTLVEVKSLLEEGATVEIEATASIQMRRRHQTRVAPARADGWGHDATKTRGTRRERRREKP